MAKNNQQHVIWLKCQENRKIARDELHACLDDFEKLLGCFSHFHDDFDIAWLKGLLTSTPVLNECDVYNKRIAKTVALTRLINAYVTLGKKTLGLTSTIITPDISNGLRLLTGILPLVHLATKNLDRNFINKITNILLSIIDYLDNPLSATMAKRINTEIHYLLRFIFWNKTPRNTQLDEGIEKMLRTSIKIRDRFNTGGWLEQFQHPFDWFLSKPFIHEQVNPFQQIVSKNTTSNQNGAVSHLEAAHDTIRKNIYRFLPPAALTALSLTSHFLRDAKFFNLEKNGNLLIKKLALFFSVPRITISCTGFSTNIMQQLSQDMLKDFSDVALLEKSSRRRAQIKITAPQDLLEAELVTTRYMRFLNHPANIGSKSHLVLMVDKNKVNDYKARFQNEHVSIFAKKNHAPLSVTLIYQILLHVAGYCIPEKQTGYHAYLEMVGAATTHFNQFPKLRATIYEQNEVLTAAFNKPNEIAERHIHSYGFQLHHTSSNNNKYVLQLSHLYKQLHALYLYGVKNTSHRDVKSMFIQDQINQAIFALTDKKFIDTKALKKLVIKFTEFGPFDNENNIHLFLKANHFNPNKLPKRVQRQQKIYKKYAALKNYYHKTKNRYTQLPPNLAANQQFIMDFFTPCEKHFETKFNPVDNAKDAAAMEEYLESYYYKIRLIDKYLALQEQLNLIGPKPNNLKIANAHIILQQSAEMICHLTNKWKTYINSDIHNFSVDDDDRDLGDMLINTLRIIKNPTDSISIFKLANAAAKLVESCKYLYNLQLFHKMPTIKNIESAANLIYKNHPFKKWQDKIRRPFYQWLSKENETIRNGANLAAAVLNIALVIPLALTIALPLIFFPLLVLDFAIFIFFMANCAHEIASALNESAEFKAFSNKNPINNPASFFVALKSKLGSAPALAGQKKPVPTPKQANGFFAPLHAPMVATPAHTTPKFRK